MRRSSIPASALAFALLSGAAMAADLGSRPAPVSFEPVPLRQPSFISELRFGGTYHEISGPEEGSVNLTGEVLFAKPFTTADLFTSYFIPRPHIGGSVNLAGDTSFAYAGFTWTVDITSSIFVEASFGGAIHNGETGRVVPVDRNALGCSPLFRESASIGFRLTPNWSIMATVEHLSNAGLCSQNRGLTNIGARVGYTF